MSDSRQPSVRLLASPDAPSPRANPIGPLEQRVLLVAAVVLLHLVVIAFVIGVAALSSFRIFPLPTSFQSPRPLQPFVLTAIALLLAHCSLSGIWWARSSWPSHAKTLAAVLSGVGLWGLLLLALLPESRGIGMRAAGWAACFASQLILAGVLATGLELTIDYRRAALNKRFSILFLLIWTTLVGCLLAVARQLAARFGWTIQNFFSWDYFLQLQALAVANALLAVGVLAGVRLNPTWYIRCGVCVLAVAFITAGTALAMLAIFRDDIGVSLSELIWLTAIQGLFLIVTLVPLEHASQRAHISK